MNAKQTQHGGVIYGTSSPFVIFHIEDSADDRELFQMAASQAKLPIRWQTAGSTKAAVAKLQELLNSTVRGVPVVWPDLVLLDFLMPVENGVGVLEFMRSQPRLRQLPVVVLTGCEDKAIEEKALSLGAKTVLLKPHSFESLVELISSVYRTFGLTGGAQRMIGGLHGTSGIWNGKGAMGLQDFRVFG